MNHPLNTPNNAPAVPARRGSVLIAAVIVLVILQLVVATMVLAGGRESDQTRLRWGQARAFYNAESAAAMSLRELAQNTDADGDGQIGGISDDGVDSNNPSLNGGRLSATFVDGTPGTITTSGTAITATRGPTVSVTRATGGTRPGLYLESWLLTADTLVDGFDWNAAPTTVGWVQRIYWPNQISKNMVFSGQLGSAVRLTGQIEITIPGHYDFGIDIDDDVKLTIDEVTVLQAGSHGACRRISGGVDLTAGLHDFQLQFTDGGGSSCLMAWWTLPGAGVATVIPPTAFKWSPDARLPGLVTTSTISFNGSSSPAAGASGWDATLGPYSAGLQIANEGDIASNATGASTITGANNSTVHGDASVGVGGNPLTAISFTSGATVSGSSAALTKRVANVFERLPLGLPGTSGALSLGGSSTLTISADTRYDSIDLSNNADLTVSGDRTLYVTGNISLANSARITVPSGSVLRLYVDGTISLSQSSTINPDARPECCWIVMRGTSKTVTMTHTSQIHGHLRAPLCGVTMSASTIFSGTLYANTFQASSQAQVYLDCGPLGGGGGSGSIIITGYTEP